MSNTPNIQNLQSSSGKLVTASNSIVNIASDMGAISTTDESSANIFNNKSFFAQYSQTMDSYDPQFDPVFVSNVLQAGAKRVFLESIEIESDYPDFIFQMSKAVGSLSGETAPIINRQLDNAYDSLATLYKLYEGNASNLFFSKTVNSTIYKFEVGIVLPAAYKLNIETANINESNIPVLNFLIKFIELD